MRRIFFLGLCPLFLVPFVAIACTVSANVGELGGGGAGVDASEDAPASSDGGTHDADAPPLGLPDGEADADPASSDAGCGVSFAQRGAFVDVGIVNGPTPELSGGTLAMGLYELTAMRVYFGGHTGTMQVRETIRVRGSSMAGTIDRLTEARSATGTFEDYPLHGETMTFELGAGPGMFVSDECPTAGFPRSHSFDMTADTLTLFDNIEVIERVYRRVE